jgi:hypothetical protein
MSIADPPVLVRACYITILLHLILLFMSFQVRAADPPLLHLILLSMAFYVRAADSHVLVPVLLHNISVTSDPPLHVLLRDNQLIPPSLSLSYYINRVLTSDPPIHVLSG